MLSLIKKKVSDNLAPSTIASSLRSTRGARLQSSGSLSLEKSAGAVRALVLFEYGPGDVRLIGGCADGGLRAWSTNTGALTSQARAYESGVSALALSRDGRNLHSASASGQVTTRDGASGTILAEYEGPDGTPVRCLCALDGGQVVGGDDAGRVFVWADCEPYPAWRFSSQDAGETSSTATSGKKNSAPPERVNAVAAWTERSTGQEFVVSGNERGILKLWQLHVGRAVAQFGVEAGGHRGAILAICVNEGVIVTAGADARVLAWYINADGELLGPPEELNVGGHHAGAVRSVVNISPGVICTGGADQRALIWDVKSRAVMFECPSTKMGAVESLLFDSSGVLYTGCAQSAIARWELPEGGDLSPRAHDERPLLTRNLSSDDFEPWRSEGPESRAAPEAPAPPAHVYKAVSEDTHKELSEARKRLHAAQTECEELRESLDAHGVRISSLEKDLKTTRNSLTAAKEENRKLKTAEAPREKSPVDAAEVESLRKKCEKMETIARKQKTKLDELKTELKASAAAREEALNEANDALEKKNEELDELRRAMGDAQNELDALRAGVGGESLNVEDMMAAAEKALLSPQLAGGEPSQEVMRELHSLREELHTTKQDTSAAEQNASKLREELDTLSATVRALEEEKSEAARKHIELAELLEINEQARQTLQSTVDEVGKARDEVSTRLRERTDEIVQLESKLNDANVATQKSSDADEKLKAQEAELARLREKLQSTESAMSALSADNETLQQKASATDELDALKEDIAKKASSIGTLEGQVKQMKQKFDNAVKKGKGFQEQTATLTSRLQDAEEKITEMAFEKQELTERLVEMESLRQELTSKDAHFQALESSRSSEVSTLHQEIEQLRGSATSMSEEMERLRATVRSRDDERDGLIGQIKSSEQAQEELKRLRESIEIYEAEMSTLKQTVETAKTKFSNAVSKGKGYQEEAVRLRKELLDKDEEIERARENSSEFDARTKELETSLEAASKKVDVGIREVEAKSEEVAHLTEQLRIANERNAQLEKEISERLTEDEVSQDARGQRWLEQQARAAAEAQVKDLADENERLRREVAAASAAAQEAWQVAASHGVRPGDSRPVSEIGSPVRDFPPRARSLFQQPTHRGAMSMVHEQYEPGVPKEEYDRIKEQCTKLREKLDHSRQAAKDAVQQVINRLEIEVMAKVHAESKAKAAEAECERAWAHAKDALATAREAQKQPTRPLSTSPIDVKPQPPPGTRAAHALERKSTDGALVLRQEHLAAILVAFVAFILGSVYSKSS
jgi:chromosome segregation ATPase/WD40 repeat protein